MAVLNSCSFCGDRVVDRDACTPCAHAAASLVLEGKRPTKTMVQKVREANQQSRFPPLRLVRTEDGQDGMQRSADLSDDGRFRYSLTRTWDRHKLSVAGQGNVCWIMLNPSVADGETDDPTIRKCIGFSQWWGYGGMSVVNLFSRIATYPKELQRAQDKFGSKSKWERVLMWHVSDASLVVVAWGAHGSQFPEHVQFVGKLLRSCEVDVYCLGTTKDGQPKHPGRIGYDTPLELFEPF